MFSLGPDRPLGEWAEQPDHESAGTADLFAYGTLVIDDVITALICRVPSWIRATAPGWRAAGIPDRDYPGLIPNLSSSAGGRIYRDLTPTEWILLDDFEVLSTNLIVFSSNPTIYRL
ncbi:MAG: gamma-glutamylcyclotransferase [Actinomycetota bacterium]|nr:gamma-glutamylcyclotransferase [Actinomycetota bacterium]